MSTPYDDIINMPHHVSKNHLPMSIKNRAAQFAPFKALEGYEDAINETRRLTNEFIELDESTKYITDVKLQMLKHNIYKHPKITVVYFKADNRKKGGEYITYTGNVKKIDSYNKTIIMLDKKVINIAMIVDVKGDIFNTLE